MWRGCFALSKNLRAAFLARGSEVLRREEIKMELSFGLHLMTPTEAKELVDGAVADGTLLRDGEGYRLADADTAPPPGKAAATPSGEAAEAEAEAGTGAAGEAGVEVADAPPEVQPEAQPEAQAATQATVPADGDGEAASASDTASLDLFRELVALAAAAAGVSRREIVGRVNRGQRMHLGVCPEVEALYVARQCGADIAPFVERVQRQVAGRHDG